MDTNSTSISKIRLVHIRSQQTGQVTGQARAGAGQRYGIRLVLIVLIVVLRPVP